MLTAAACLALVGTASAAWVYAGTATASANVGVKVASYADAGTIEVTGDDNLRVYLDKGSVSIIKEDESIPLKATYTKPDGFDEKTVTLTYQVVISKFLANYVTFADGVNTITTTDGTVATDFAYTWKSNEEITIDTLPGLAWTSTYSTYKEGIGGSNLLLVDDYRTVINAITGKGIGDTFDWNQEWDCVDKISSHYLAINFKAVLANS